MSNYLQNDIHSFKGREIDYSKPVMVYRNLTRKGQVYSIKQSGKVVAFAYRLTLKNVDFIVNHKTQAKIRINKHRQVHAYAKGFIGATPCFRGEKEVARITYNPYHNDNFVKITSTGKTTDVFKTECVTFGEGGLIIYQEDFQPVNYYKI
jgi:hypothetical protein